MGKFCLFLVFFQIAGLFVILSLHTSNNTLKLVQILFRHGERNPLRSYTNDPYKNYSWPEGWNQLSKRGKLQEYNLGIALRKRYENFLPEIYHEKDIYVESSYADRCLMSAQLLLAGLYPPKSDQIWNEELLWQPIPVHSIPRKFDNKLAIKQSCERYSKEVQEVHKTPRIKRITEENRDLLNYLSEHTGDQISTIRQLETLYNTLEIEQLNNLTLPNWTENVFNSNMKDLAALSLASFTETEFMKRMHGGVLVKEILENMEIKSDLKPQMKRKMYLYSAHDLTVVSLLRVLGFEKLIKPEFGASVIVELHEKSENLFVKFFYVANPSSEPSELFHEICGTQCRLEDLKKILQPVIPDDWDKECLL